MFIREVDLFLGIPSHMIDEIAALASEEVLPAGGVLFRRGDAADSLFILEEGSLEIMVGEEAHTCFLLDQSGDLFGWSALVEPNQYTASARCVRESKVIRIDGNRLMRIFERHPAEGLRVMRRLAGIIGSRLMMSYKEIMTSRKEGDVPSYG